MLYTLYSFKRFSFERPSPSPERKVKLALVDAWSSNLKHKSMIEN